MVRESPDRDEAPGFLCQLRDSARDAVDTLKRAREQMHSTDGHWSFFFSFFFNERAHEGSFQCVRWVVMESFAFMVSFRLASGAFRHTHVETCWDMLHSLLSVVSSMGGSLLSLHWERGDQIEVDEIV